MGKEAAKVAEAAKEPEQDTICTPNSKATAAGYCFVCIAGNVGIFFGLNALAGVVLHGVCCKTPIALGSGACAGGFFGALGACHPCCCSRSSSDDDQTGKDKQQSGEEVVGSQPTTTTPFLAGDIQSGYGSTKREVSIDALRLHIKELSEKLERLGEEPRDAEQEDKFNQCTSDLRAAIAEMGARQHEYDTLNDTAEIQPALLVCN